MALSSFVQRTISALILGPLLLLAILFLEGDGFSILLALLLLPAAWEWGRLSGQLRLWPHLGYVALLLVLFYVSRFLSVGWLLWVALFWWGGALLWLWRFPEKTGWLFSTVACHLAGVVILIPAWRSIELIHRQEQGVALLLVLLLLIWSADIGAYLVGRRFGERRLAPNVSPKKSIEGVAGGVAFSLLVATAAYHLMGWSTLGVPLFLLSMAGVVLFSIVGDLVESAYKRTAGIKDSGNLIPGHGGILDRVDSLTAAAPIFLYLLLISGGF